MAFGDLPLPNLDDRGWEELRDEALAFARRRNPEWSDHSPSDIGVTIVEAVAWLLEGMQYRLNQLPDRNYLAFLNLLGVTPQAMAPATATLTFQPSSPHVVVIDAGTRVSTSSSAPTGRLVFETAEDLTVLPCYCEQVVSRRYLGAAACVAGNEDPPPQGYFDDTLRLRGIDRDETPGDSALEGLDLILPSGDDVALFFALSSAVEKLEMLVGVGESVRNLEDLDLHWPLADVNLPLELSYAISTVTDTDKTPEKPLGEEPSQGTTEGDEETKKSTWKTGRVERDATDGLRQDGRISLTCDVSAWARASLGALEGLSRDEPEAALGEEAYWASLVVRNPSDQAVVLRLHRTVVNSVLATTTSQNDSSSDRSDDEGFEVLGVSDGSPFQEYDLHHAPVYSRGTVPHEDLRLEVRPPGHKKGVDYGSWSQVEDLGKVPPHGRSYRLEPARGQIHFGDQHLEPDPTTGIPQSQLPAVSGGIPPKDWEIAIRYRYVQAAPRLRAPAGSITQPEAGKLPTGVEAVWNPGPASGGVAAESLEATARRGSEIVQGRSRAVTAADIEYLARVGLQGVREARALGPSEDADGLGGLFRRVGHISVIVMHDDGSSDLTPMPGSTVLTSLAHFLLERAPVGISLSVHGPRYLQISIGARIEIYPRYLSGDLREQLEAEVKKGIREFLHPLDGGPTGQGWRIGEALELADLAKKIRPLVGDRGFIADLHVRSRAPLYLGERPEGVKEREKPNQAVREEVADYECLCGAITHSVSVLAVGS